ncbi:MAG: radical SAM protein [Patescibacteria group bacterium]
MITDRLLFIVPPYITYTSFVKPDFNERVVFKKNGSFGSLVTEMPLGILSISSYLKKNINSIEIKFIDFNVVLNKMVDFSFGSFIELFYDFFSKKEWIDFKPTVVGISTLFAPAYHNMIDLGQAVRDLFPSALIVAGGGIPTNMFNQIFKESYCFDALCYGEGEKPFLGLMMAEDKVYFLENNLSWITNKKIKNKQSFEHDFVQDLDEIPFLDYDILNIKDYGINPILSLFPLEEERKRKGMSVMISRGCPHRCSFCSSYTVHGRKMRYYSMKRVKEDFKRLKDKYGAETLIFFDDHLMADKKRVYEIFDIIKNLRLTAFFPNSLALYALDRKMLEALKSIGVNNLVLSVESGSNRVLKEIMHKPLNLSIVKRVVDDCRQLGIVSDVSILIGLPGETKQDIEDARSFLKTLNGSWFRISMATPLVGSEMLDVCLKNNYIKGDYINCDFKRAIVETEDFTPEYIQEKAYFLNLELNFVENNDFKLGNYAVALKGFENTIRVKNDHAFAYYFAAKCCLTMNLDEKYREYKIKYEKILKESVFWRNLVNQFVLVSLK